ncbi:hypothetical protein Acr_12g0000770 [Actinidia rufa]|uniref:Retrotransposon gag domain-containing protein n=1 Tax=Actinidia rufa TaxID=165716 RepID=A0A7J0FGH5_9ERIC|nr:hypothetical protein Acr_12g0000770 [Actinidia rufa]
MNWARFKVIFREKFVPRAIQNAKCSEFDQLKQLGMTVADYEWSFTNLAEYAPHLVATDEIRAHRFEEGLRHEIRKAIRLLDRTKVKNEIRCFHYTEVEHIKRNCPRLRTEVVAPRGGLVGGNVRPAGNAMPGGNRPGNPENRGGNVNNQRQGQGYAL